MRQGKGSTVAFLEFDTTYHATKALEQLRTMKVNGDEEVVASYAPQPKSWQTVGGVQGRDFGGEEFAWKEANVDNWCRRSEGSFRVVGMPVADLPKYTESAE